MIIRLQTQENVLLTEWRLDLNNRQLARRTRPRLRPGVHYWLRMYLEPDEPTAPHWLPVPHEEVFVLMLTRISATEAWEPEPPPGARLLLRAQFQVDNDRAATRILRWGFRDDPRDGEFQTWRLDFLVAARRWRQLGLITLFAAGFWIAELFELFTTRFSGRDSGELSNWFDVSMIGFGFCVLASGLALRVYEWVSNLE